MSDPNTHRAKKRFGQNFLTDQQVIHQIIRAISPQSTDRLIEIGPGFGALTQHLFTRCPSMTAIELDRDLAAHLRNHYPSMDLVESDALKVDFSKLLPRQKNSCVKITGNLPYNISTPLLFHLLKYEAEIDCMYFMLQKEVVDRLAATPNSKAYGRLTVMIQYYCDIEPLFSIAPHAFNPAPKVQSAFVALTPKREKLLLNDFTLFEKLVNAAFQQRRKTLRNALKHYIPDHPSSILFPYLTRRAEALSVEDFVTLTNTLSNIREDS